MTIDVKVPLAQESTSILQQLTAGLGRGVDADASSRAVQRMLNVIAVLRARGVHKDVDAAFFVDPGPVDVALKRPKSSMSPIQK